jgi:hypothetical protein
MHLKSFLRVTVFNCINIPKNENVGEIHPYVILRFHGNKKKYLIFKCLIMANLNFYYLID